SLRSFAGLGVGGQGLGRVARPGAQPSGVTHIGFQQRYTRGTHSSPQPPTPNPRGSAGRVRPFPTLRGRLATTYAALAWLAIVASAIYTAGSLRGGLLGRVGLDLAAEARLVADNVREPLARDDRAAVAAYVARLPSLTRTHILIRDRR